MAVSAAIKVAGEDTAEVQVVPFAAGRAAFFTRRAPGKASRNEDALALIPSDDGAGMLLVADGVGGYPDGDVASRTVVESLDEAVARGTADGAALRDCMLDGIERANRRILEGQAGCASTVAAVCLGSSRSMSDVSGSVSAAWTSLRTHDSSATTRIFGMVPKA